MDNKLIELTEDEFDSQYTLVPNHLNPRASWSVGDSGGCLFETYGEEFEFVKQYDPRHVWTVVEAAGHECILSGLHFVNRLGYFITREPVPENTEIEVQIQ